MKRLKCRTTCYGFRDRFWNEGETVDVDDGEEYPAEHFVQVKRQMDDDDYEDDVEEMPKKRKRKSESDVIETTFSN